MHAYLLIATGDRDSFHLMTSWLIMGLLGSPGERHIRVVTDHPERYHWLAEHIEIRVVTQQELSSWFGLNGYYFRSKLISLIEAMQSKPEAHWSFLDSDIAVRGDLVTYESRLADGQAYMHLRENYIGQRRDRGEYVDKLVGKDWAGLRVEAKSPMWNSGVIGIPTTIGVAAVKQALAALDAAHGAGVETHAIEQLFMCQAMIAAHPNLLPADQWFAHYWGNKPAWTAAIGERLAGWWQRGTPFAEALTQVQADPIHLPTQVRDRRILKYIPPFLMGKGVNVSYTKSW